MTEAANTERLFYEEELSSGEFTGRDFSGQPVTLDRCVCAEGRLVFTRCVFSSLQMKNMSAVDEVRFVACRIDKLHLWHCDVSIELDTCEVATLEAECSDVRALDVERGSVSSMSVVKDSTLSTFDVNDGAHIEDVQFRNSDLGSLVVNASRIGMLNVQGTVGSVKLKQGGDLGRFSIADMDCLERFLVGLRDLPEGSISAKRTELLSAKRVCLAACSRYEDLKQFQETDRCLVEFRRLMNRLHRLEATTPLGKAAYAVQDVVVGRLFGWGVRILNVVITALCIIAVFAAVYAAFTLATCGGDVGATVFEALWHSVDRFFFGSDTSMLPPLDTIESVVGVVVLTVVTGVVARQIIR